MKQSSFYANYKIGPKIGSGSFGRIFAATNPLTGEQVAIKIEPKNCSNPQLVHENALYKIISDKNPTAVGIPRIHLCTSQSDYINLVMELLGPSLEDKFNLCGRKFSLKTVLMLAKQMIARLDFIHSCGVVHRDIKPENFAVGLGKNQDIIYLIDLGLSRVFMKDGRHIDLVYGKKLIGTARYASINAHKGITQSRRDDLESIGYVWIYFLKGRLPWQGLQTNEKSQRYDLIKEKKIETPVSDLCEGLPIEFAEYLTYVKSLKFEEEPNYEKLYALFEKLFEKEGFVEDFDYDWKSIKTEPVIKNNGTMVTTEGFRESEFLGTQMEEMKQNTANKTLMQQKASNYTTKSTGNTNKNNDKTSKACLPIFSCFT
uniref:Predicted protein n=1 Tax=Hordeum vulgare subsp. vulgare TaxID=112509 RepID=F2DVB7_HORVV|nr:predicted protein [Hordeum vulgare subsp. vulgare]